MKIKYTIVPKLNTLSAKEMDLFFYLAKRMDQDTGYVEGVYYRHVMKHARMCKQSFYNALRGLEKKGIVVVHKISDIDYNVLILDNDFPDDAARSKGYVKLSRKVFRSKKFWALKVHEKFMLLEFMRRTHGGKGRIIEGIEDFYKKFMELLGVSKRVIRSYMHNLKQFFGIKIKKGNFCITYNDKVFEDGPNLRNHKSEEAWCYEHLVKKECWRSHISYDEENIKDTAFLVKQYRGFCNGTGNAVRLLMLCIQESIEGIERKKRRLQQKYIHKLMIEGLGLPETAPEE